MTPDQIVENKTGETARVLLIGQKPETVNFDDPHLPYGFSIDTIKESIQISLRQITERGWHADMLTILPDESAGTDIVNWLDSHEPYDCIVIGAGIRIPDPNLLFFERVINAVHKAAPSSAIGFNTRPEETADAAARWLSKPEA